MWNRTRTWLRYAAETLLDMAMETFQGLAWVCGYILVYGWPLILAILFGLWLMTRSPSTHDTCCLESQRDVMVIPIGDMVVPWISYRCLRSTVVRHGEVCPREDIHW